MLLFDDAVAFARINKQIGSDTLQLQRSIELLALPDGIREVRLSLKNQRRATTCPDSRSTPAQLNRLTLQLQSDAVIAKLARVCVGFVGPEGKALAKSRMKRVCGANLSRR